MNREIIIRYFVGCGDEATGILVKAKTARDAHFARVNNVVEKHGARCAWGGRSSISAIAYEIDDGEKAGIKDFFLKPKIAYSDGKRYAVYTPDKRYREGKAIFKEFKDIGQFNYSDFIMAELGMDCSVFGVLEGRMVRCVSSAGNYGEKLVVRLPCGGDSRPKEIVVPGFLVELKKSEFIAIIEEGILPHG